MHPRREQHRLMRLPQKYRRSHRPPLHRGRRRATAAAAATSIAPCTSCLSGSAASGGAISAVRSSSVGVGAAVQVEVGVVVLLAHEFGVVVEQAQSPRAVRGGGGEEQRDDEREDDARRAGPLQKQREADALDEAPQPLARARQRFIHVHTEEKKKKKKDRRLASPNAKKKHSTPCSTKMRRSLNRKACDDLQTTEAHTRDVRSCRGARGIRSECRRTRSRKGPWIEHPDCVSNFWTCERELV